MNPKAQAAMEFLLTYGWAIVVVFTTFSVWGFYFDFYPLKDGMAFSPETCTMDIGLSCLDHRLYAVEDLGEWYNNLEIAVKNNMGAKIRIRRITIEHYELVDFNVVGIILQNGQTADPPVEVNDLAQNNRATTLQKGQAYDLPFTLVVVNTDTGLEHQFSGRITGQVD